MGRRKDGTYCLNYAALKKIMDMRGVTQKDISLCVDEDKSVINRGFKNSKRVIGDRMRVVMGEKAVEHLDQYLRKNYNYYLVDKETYLEFLQCITTLTNVKYSNVNNELFIMLMAYAKAKKQDFALRFLTQKELDSYYKPDDRFKNACIGFINQINKSQLRTTFDYKADLYQSFRRSCELYFGDLKPKKGSLYQKETALMQNPEEFQEFKELCMKFFCLEETEEIHTAKNKETLISPVSINNKTLFSKNEVKKSRRIYLRALFGTLIDQLEIHDVILLANRIVTNQHYLSEGYDKKTYIGANITLEANRWDSPDNGKGFDANQINKLSLMLRCTEEYLLGESDHHERKYECSEKGNAIPWIVPVLYKKDNN